MAHPLLTRRVGGSESDTQVPGDAVAADASESDAGEPTGDASTSQCTAGQRAEDGGCVADDSCPLGCSGRGPTCAQGLEGGPDATCAENLCGPGKMKGDIVCNPETKNAEQCLADGTWVQFDRCNIPEEICRAGQGCVENGPQEIGNVAVDAEWEPWQIATDYAYFIPVVASTKWRLMRFRLHARAAGGVCKMALYDDLNNRPHNMLTYSARDINVIAGVNGELATSQIIEMEAGRTYWLGAKCWASDGPVELLQRSSASASYFQTTMTPYAAFWEGSLGGSVKSGIAFPFFMQVQEVP